VELRDVETGADEFGVRDQDVEALALCADSLRPLLWAHRVSPKHLGSQPAIAEKRLQPRYDVPPVGVRDIDEHAPAVLRLPPADPQEFCFLRILDVQIEGGGPA